VREITIDSVVDMNGIALKRAITNRLVIVRASERLGRGDILRRILASSADSPT
jgi:hypothetical protein